MNYQLMIMIIPHNEGERITSVLKKAGATGGTVAMGRSYSENKVLRLFGFGETSNDIVFCAAEDGRKEKLIKALEEETENEKEDYGILLSLDITKLYKSGEKDIKSSGKREEPAMDAKKHKKHELITVILNKGFADDAMAAARSAGAGGGTVIHGRGTARPEDASFFGITLVPEKEILLILTEKETASAVLEALHKLPCLSQPGSGIAFCIETMDFINLGKK